MLPRLFIIESLGCLAIVISVMTLAWGTDLRTWLILVAPCVLVVAFLASGSFKASRRQDDAKAKDIFRASVICLCAVIGLLMTGTVSSIPVPTAAEQTEAENRNKGQKAYVEAIEIIGDRKSEELDKAFKLLDEAQTMGIERALVEKRRVELLLFLGRFEEVEESLAILKASGGERPDHSVFARAYHAHGRHHQAWKEVQMALKHGHPSWLLTLAIEIAVSVGELDQAKILLKKYPRNSPPERLKILVETEGKKLDEPGA